MVSKYSIAGIVLCLLVATFAVVQLPAQNGEDLQVFRIGFTRSTMGPVNENDAMAAVQIWVEKFLRDLGIAGDPHPLIFDGAGDLRQALMKRDVECINITMDQYPDIQDLIEQDRMIGGVLSGSVMVEYVVLVRRESSLHELDSLRGKKLGIVQTASHSLATIWLDTVLHRLGYGFSEDFFVKLQKVDDVRDAVLPVFFGQLDSCVVTRKSFEILAELNPQIAKKLKVITLSPPLVPMIFGFRKQFESPVIDKVMREVTAWHLSPAGRQILTLFKTDSLQKLPFGELDTTIDILRNHRKLRNLPEAQPQNRPFANGQEM